MSVDSSLIEADRDQQFADWAESVTLREVTPHYDLQSPDYSETVTDTPLSALVQISSRRTSDGEATFLVHTSDLPDPLAPLLRVVYDGLEFDVVELSSLSDGTLCALACQCGVSRPSVLKHGILFPLPRPLTSFSIQDAWDFDQSKVPLADGDSIAGHSRQGVALLIQGQIGFRAGILDTSEDSRVEILEAWRTILNVEDQSDKYGVVFYHNEDSQTIRRYNRCSTVRFEYEMAEKERWKYSLIVHAGNPAIDASSVT